MTSRILLLAGTQEARALAGRLFDMPRIKVIASLAGVTSNPHSIPAETRRGGFGGIEGLIDYLKVTEVSAIIDATHPFAMQMPWQAEQAAEALGLPRLRLLRPAWQIDANWQTAPDLERAAKLLPTGARVFLATGRQRLEPFAARRDCWFLMRSIEPPATLPPHIRHLGGLPGKDYASEFAILCSHRITHLVSKNSGGQARAKLDAATGLGAQVILIDRPEQPPGPTASTIAETVAWLRDIVAIDRKTPKP